MRVLISPKASEFLQSSEATSRGTAEAMSEAIRHNLDQLKEKQYALGFHMKAGSVVSTFKDSPLNLCYHFKENFSVLYLASEETKENARTFFEQLIPNCTEFHVL